MATIRDIAKQSGYAKSTISRYINGTGYVSKQTGVNIQRVIDKLHYHPNQLARELSTGDTNRIGVVIPYAKHHYVTELVRGLLDSAISAKEELLLLPSEYDVKKELHYLKQLRDHEFDSLIFTSRQISLSKIAEYRQYGQIICMEDASEYGLSSVYVQRTPGYKELFTWLRSQQIHRIALMFSRADESSPTYRAEMNCFKHLLPEVTYQTFAHINAYPDAQKVISAIAKDHFDCVLANTDDVAAYLMRALPEKMSQTPLIVSAESQITGRLLQIPSVCDHAYELGGKLFEAAITDHPVQVSFDSKFLLRRQLNE